MGRHSRRRWEEEDRVVEDRVVEKLAAKGLVEYVQETEARGERAFEARQPMVAFSLLVSCLCGKDPHYSVL